MASLSPTIINGYEVYFPADKKPFAAQLAVISKALVALTAAQNALLESPTGTGKTLALLTSALSWQKRDFELTTKIAAEADAVAVMGTEAESLREEEQSSSDQSKDDIHKSKLVPKVRRKKVFFCSRTHSQLQQVINELRECHSSYIDDIQMSLLSSRINLCVNAKAKEKATSKGLSIDEVCRELLDQKSCSFAYRFHTVTDELNKSHVWDIEDATYTGSLLSRLEARSLSPFLSFYPSFFVLLNLSFLFQTSMRVFVPPFSLFCFLFCFLSIFFYFYLFLSLSLLCLYPCLSLLPFYSHYIFLR